MVLKAQCRFQFYQKLSPSLLHHILLLFIGIYRILADFGFLTTTTTGDLLLLGTAFWNYALQCFVPRWAGFYRKFWQYVYWVVFEGMSNEEGGVQCIKECFSNVCGNIQSEGRGKKCFISCFCPLEFLGCVILGLKHELKIVSTSSQCFLVNWGCWVKKYLHLRILSLSFCL